MKKISPKSKWTSTNFTDDIFCVRISPENDFVVCTLSSGSIGLLSYSTGRLSYLLEHSPEHIPVTSIRFIPKNPKNFIAVSSDGFIKEWKTHNPSVNWSIQENNNINSLDISINSDKFATAGLDKIVRLYDYETKSVTTTLQYTTDKEIAHTNRIFSIKFDPNNTNILYSGGWDDTIHVWDLRIGQSVHSLYGAHICGDTIDVCNHLLLSGSWRIKEQIQVWDLRTLNLQKSFSWPIDRNCLIYTAQFHSSGKYIVSGGSSSNEVSIISLDTFENVCEPLHFNSSVFSIYTKNNDLVIGTQNNGVHMFSLE
ncbi:WD repeat protein [Histomonas meleagridis]|uniref:WD repeat protein n=1 Tax=Histomonas meleagridis TaxID=135588 RepID=UPI00355A4DC3|nr:WD repeat protein [Histomonas meleagridis]KAH0802765.1 WD repeat protein [Histomonas meleagridis]